MSGRVLHGSEPLEKPGKEFADDIELEGISYPYIRSAETDHSELKVIK